MAVYAPGDNPSDHPDIDPGMLARIRGWVERFNPIGSANAAESVSQGPNPLSNPSPVDPRLSGGGPLIPLGAFGGGQPPAPMPLGAPVPPISSQPVTAAPPIGAAFGAPPMPAWSPPGPFRNWHAQPAESSAPPIARHPLQGPGTGPAGPVVGGSVVGAPPISAAPPPLGAPETRRMPYPGQIDPHGVFASAQPSVPGAAVGAPSQSPFVQLDYRPNADVAGGALSRGGPPSMTALDLSGLFGGGQSAAAVPVATQPRTKSKIPATARADVPPQASGPMDPSIIARRKMKRSKASSTSQGGGY